MSFLEPLLLAGLPVVLLPLIIHLIHRQRHRTLPWGAMMFLLDARRSARGMARLRYWLIMAARMLAIAGLVFVISRPLAGGWMGWALGGRAETILVLLDRSVSMGQNDGRGGATKLSRGIDKLSGWIETVGGGAEVVLIDSMDLRAREIESAEMLRAVARRGVRSTSADIPGMLQAALDYVVANQTGRTDIWIVSDLRRNDWRRDDARWSMIRDGFEQRPGLQFYVLAFPEPADDNLAVWVHRVRRRAAGGQAEVVLDLTVRSEAALEGPLQVPLEFVLNGARTVLNIEMAEQEYRLQSHRLAIDPGLENGWGFVALPRDANAGDNAFFFVFAEPPEHYTAIVADDPESAESIRLAAVSPADPDVRYTADVFPPDRVNQIEWDRVSLLVWQSATSSRLTARQVQNHVEKGRALLVFPPLAAQGEILGGLFEAVWDDWRGEGSGTPQPVVSWRGDAGLLRHTESGQPLPVGALQVFRHRMLRHRGQVLARLEGGVPLLVRSTAHHAPVYFCSTLPAAPYSSLAEDGVTFYVLVQRALAMGAAAQGKARLLNCGAEAASVVQRWEPRTAAAAGAVSIERPLQAGVFQSGEQWIALNRPDSEDLAGMLDADAARQLFAGLDARFVQSELRGEGGLASEIWRAFLALAALALVLEAWLCMPDRT